MNHERLVQALIDAARTLVTDYQVNETLDRLCDDVCAILDVTGAGVMIADPQGHLRFIAASNEVVKQIESLQIQLGEGPCLRAYETGEQVVVPDLGATEQIFPHFGPHAWEAGMQGVYSFPLRAGDTRIGALNLYRDHPGEMPAEDVEAGQVLADVATVSILNSRTLEESTRLSAQLQHALDSRVVIEQAKGKLSEQLQLGVDEAFDRLRALARRTGRKLHDVAREVVEGTIPADGISPDARRSDE